MSGSSRAALGALAVAAALAVPSSPAQAATLTGTVVAPPAGRGAHAVAVSILTGARTVKVVVARGAIRTRTAPIAADRLRLGDRVTADGRRLRVTRRGPVASFHAIAARRTQAATAVRAALASLDATSATGSADQLRTARTALNLAIADLDDQAAALDAILAAARPLAHGSDAYLAGLQAGADAARTAAARLAAAVTRLDQAIVNAGTPSAPPLPISSTAAVSDVLHGLLDLLRVG